MVPRKMGLLRLAKIIDAIFVRDCILALIWNGKFYINIIEKIIVNIILLRDIDNFIFFILVRILDYSLFLSGYLRVRRE